MNEKESKSFAAAILPPGSTSYDLQEAIDSASSGDTIVISDDILFSDAVTLPAGKEITIQSDAGHNRIMFQSNTNTRHFSIAGTLILKDVTLEGMHSGTMNGGGGINVNGGALAANEGVIIQNCYTSGNGGAVYLTNSVFSMNGGTIIRCSADNSGGGIYLSNSDFTMIGGIISGNNSNSYGGGIYLTSFSTFVMSGGIISGNISDSSGGGFYISNSSSLIIYEGIISGNTAVFGGGIYMSDSHLAMNTVMISANTANYGGGIFIRFSAYGDMSTSVSTVFSCNRADTAHAPPENAGTLYPNIQFASTTITGHPLNNYDIGYTAGAAIDATFRVTYNANGGIGYYTGAGIEPCDTDTVLSAEYTGIDRYGYTFTDWNTVTDGSGDSYFPEDEITVIGNITLYAQWEANLYTVTYDANGGNGSFAHYIAYDTLYTVLSSKESGISYIMHSLTSWNTQPDGTGTSYSAGDTFTINGEAVLYAQWKEITRSDVVSLILSCIAIEALAVAHILNAEGEKLQYILGTLEDKSPGEITVCDIMEINSSVQKTLRDVIKTEMLLQFQTEDAASLMAE